MQSWHYELGDVLIIERNGTEVVARVAGFVDSLDNTKPLYVNLRVSDGLRWGERKVKVQPEQIRGEDKDWYARRDAAWESGIKQTVDTIIAKMTPAERQRMQEEEAKRRRRSALDVMIDRACGLE